VSEKYNIPTKLQLPNCFKIDEALEARQFGEADRDDIVKIATDTAVKKYIPWANSVSDLQSATEQIVKFNEQYESGFSKRYGIYNNENSIIGYFGVWTDTNEPNALHTGTAILPEYRGLGLANKCRNKIVEIATEQGYSKLISFVAHSNIESRSMLIKAGYKPTGLHNAHGEEKYELSLENE
jgi:RimJ/RimL family protein N-acetyltransferase